MNDTRKRKEQRRMVGLRLWRGVSSCKCTWELQLASPPPEPLDGRKRTQQQLLPPPFSWRPTGTVTNFALPAPPSSQPSKRATELTGLWTGQPKGRDRSHKGLKVNRFERTIGVIGARRSPTHLVPLVGSANIIRLVNSDRERERQQTLASRPTDC